MSQTQIERGLKPEGIRPIEKQPLEIEQYISFIEHSLDARGQVFVEQIAVPLGKTTVKQTALGVLIQSGVNDEELERFFSALPQGFPPDINIVARDTIQTPQGDQERDRIRYGDSQGLGFMSPHERKGLLFVKWIAERGRINEGKVHHEGQKLKIQHGVIFDNRVPARHEPSLNQLIQQSKIAQAKAETAETSFTEEPTEPLEPTPKLLFAKWLVQAGKVSDYPNQEMDDSPEQAPWEVPCDFLTHFML